MSTVTSLVFTHILDTPNASCNMRCRLIFLIHSIMHALMFKNNKAISYFKKIKCENKIQFQIVCWGLGVLHLINLF